MLVLAAALGLLALIWLARRGDCAVAAAGRRLDIQQLRRQRAVYLTLAIWVKDLTGSDAAAGLVFLFLGLPAFLAPVAGHVADRFSRRRLVVIANLVGALGVLSLVFVRDAGDVWIVYVVTFGYGLLTYLTSACASGLIKDLVPDDGLAAANGLLATIDQGLRLLSPLAGAGLYAAFGGTAVRR